MGTQIKNRDVSFFIGCLKDQNLNNTAIKAFYNDQLIEVSIDSYIYKTFHPLIENSISTKTTVNIFVPLDNISGSFTLKPNHRKLIESVPELKKHLAIPKVEEISLELGLPPSAKTPEAISKMEISIFCDGSAMQSIEKLCSDQNIVTRLKTFNDDFALDYFSGLNRIVPRKEIPKAGANQLGILVGFDVLVAMGVPQNLEELGSYLDFSIAAHKALSK